MVLFYQIKETDKQFIMQIRKALVVPILLFSLLLIGQNRNNIYTAVDQMPYFIGCEAYADDSAEKQLCSNQAVVDYISNALFYPELAQHKSIEGIVYIGFVVDEQGQVKQPTLLKDIGGGCGEEAIRVVKEMPPWQPALLRGEAVKMQLTLPIAFQFSDQPNNLYSFRWGNLSNYEVTKKELKKNLSAKVQVFNEEGTALSLASLTFSVNKGSKISSASSSGNITFQMEKLVKRLKKGSLFSVIGTIQVDGQFIEIDKEFMVI